MPERLTKTAMLARSEMLSKTSNEHSRAGGQACLLINGGAATAVIAYLAKDEVSFSMSKDAVWALMGYGLGVVLAALMIISVMQCLDCYSQYWLARVEKRRDEMASWAKSGHRWVALYRTLGGFSVLCFSGSSAWFGIALRGGWVEGCM
jgi:hypothetical protein